MEAENPSGTLYGIIIGGVLWAIIAVPTALIGSLFKKHETDPSKIRRNRIVLICVGVGAVLFSGYMYHETSTKTIEQLKQENAAARTELNNVLHR